MRVALVHDYLNQYGGAERVLAVLSELFPQAPIFTLLYDERKTHGKFQKRKIITSFLQHLPGALSHHHWYFPLMPKAVERWDFFGFDLVISQSASFAKGIITPPGVKHFCYLLTPTRFLWDESASRIHEELPRFTWLAAHFLVKQLRTWDYQAARRPHIIVSISEHIKRKTERIYRREVREIVYPPVETARLARSHARPPQERHPYFLIVSRLIPYKRIDIAIQACTSLGVELRIIGTGRDSRRLLELAGPKIKLLGELPQELTDAYFQHAEAFLMPQVEDFGIAACEAMAAGTPVIAYREGGALETVVEGKTGLFFEEQTPASLARTMERFSRSQFDPKLLQEHAKQFDLNIFREHFLHVLHSSLL